MWSRDRTIDIANSYLSNGQTVSRRIPSKTLNDDHNRMRALEKLESVRMKKHGPDSYETELKTAIDEKYGHIN